MAKKKPRVETHQAANCPRNEEASSVIEAFHKALTILGDWRKASSLAPYFWFRGVNSDVHELLPGAYWRTDYEELSPLVPFAQEGVAFTNVGSIDSWDTYYLAQHHGIPTRLLDWTESFAAALFFALDNWDETTNPCVWLLVPGEVNRLTIKWYGIVSPENYRAIDIWLPRPIAEPNHKAIQDGGYDYNNDLPLAIYPKKSNGRIIAQQGVFSIHGRNRQSLNEFIIENSDNPGNALARVTLKGISKTDAMNELETLGIRRHTVYPDIDNYVKYLQSIYW